MDVFEMTRHADESGVSGTGKVLEGIVFSDGTTVVRWTVPNKANSTAIYDNFEDFKAIHIDSHPTNETELAWDRHDGIMTVGDNIVARYDQLIKQHRALQKEYKHLEDLLSYECPYKDKHDPLGERICDTCGGIGTLSLSEKLIELLKEKQIYTSADLLRLLPEEAYCPRCGCTMLEGKCDSCEEEDR